MPGRQSHESTAAMMERDSRWKMAWREVASATFQCLQRQTLHLSGSTFLATWDGSPRAVPAETRTRRTGSIQEPQEAQVHVGGHQDGGLITPSLGRCSGPAQSAQCAEQSGRDSGAAEGSRRRTREEETAGTAKRTRARRRSRTGKREGTAAGWGGKKTPARLWSEASTDRRSAEGIEVQAETS